MILFPGCATHDKAPRPSIGDGLKPQTAFAAADSARTDNWTDVPETQNTVSRIPHFSGCAAHGKSSRPSIENGLKPYSPPGQLDGYSAPLHILPAPGALRAVPLR